MPEDRIGVVQDGDCFYEDLPLQGMKSVLALGTDVFQEEKDSRLER